MFIQVLNSDDIVITEFSLSFKVNMFSIVYEFVYEAKMCSFMGAM